MATPKVLTYQDIATSLTAIDLMNASDAGIIPSNFTTNDQSIIMQMDFDVYFWLRDTKKDLRFVNTITEKESNQSITNPTTQTPGNTVTPTECINTTHDKAYDYKKSIQEDGTIKYFFVGNYGKYKSRFPDWTEAVDDGSYGTIRRNAIVEKVKFDCKAGQPTSTPNPDPPETSQTSNIVENSEDPKQDTLYGTVVDKKTLEPIEGANIQYGTLSTLTDDIGMFSLDVPSLTKPSPPPPKECINTDHDRAYNYKRLTYEDGLVEYYFIGLYGKYKQNFPNWTLAPPDTLVGKTSGTINRDAIVERVKFDCTDSNRPIVTPNQPTQEEKDDKEEITKLEITAVDYEKKSFIPFKGDGSYRNNLGIIGLNPIKVQLDNDVLNSLLVPELPVQEAVNTKKNSKWYQNQKLIDLLNKLKEVLIPMIIGMIAKFGITKLNELYQNNKDKIKDEVKNSVCPTPEEIKKLIKRKNKLVKQLNNAQKTIETALKIIGITRSITQVFTAVVRGIDIAQLALPTAIPGVTAGVITKVDDIKKDVLDKTEQFNKIINDVFLTLNILRAVLVQTITYLNLLDSLIAHCSQGNEDINELTQEQLSSELTALTEEQSNQESPVISTVNGFTMGIETEITTNPLKRRRATATNPSGVVMLRGEYSFSSIDQILIDELVFYIQTNDLKAD